MASIYDKPAELNLQDTYVPLPFQEMMQQANVLRDNYNQATETVDQGELALGKINAYGEADKSLLANKVNDFNTFAETMAKGDLTDPLALSKIRRKVTQLGTDNELKSIVSNKAAIDDAQKRYQEATKNTNFKDYYANDFKNKLTQYSKEGIKSGIDFGNTSFLNAVDLKENVEKPMFNDLKADIEQINQGLYTKQQKAITLGKVNNMADLNLSRYMTNPQVQLDMQNDLSSPEAPKYIAGQYISNIEDLKNSGAIDEKRASELIIAAGKGEIPVEAMWAKNRLISTGKEFVFNETTKTADQVAIHKADMAFKREIENKKLAATKAEDASTLTGRTAIKVESNLYDLAQGSNAQRPGYNKAKVLNPYTGKTIEADVKQLPPTDQRNYVELAFTSPNSDMKTKHFTGVHRWGASKISNDDIVGIIPGENMIVWGSNKVGGGNTPSNYADAGIQGQTTVLVTENGLKRAVGDLYRQKEKAPEGSQLEKILKVKFKELELDYDTEKEEALTTLLGVTSPVKYDGGQDAVTVTETYNSEGLPTVERTSTKTKAVYKLPGVLSNNILTDEQTRNNIQYDKQRLKKEALDASSDNFSTE